MKNRIKAIAVGYVLILLLLMLSQGHPGKSIFRLFAGPFLSLHSLGNILNLTGLLLITGTAVALAFQSGEFNLGGEGQAYAGALTAAMTGALMQRMFPGLGIPLYLLAGGLAGFAAGLVSGILKRFAGTSVLISSYLLSGGIIAVINFLVAGPLREESSYLLSTSPLPDQLRIPALIPGTNAHIGILLMPLIPAALWFFLNKTVKGYELRLKGLNAGFAEYGGIRVGSYDIWPIAASGFLHGLAGAFLVGGNHFACLQGGTAGLGWNGIGAALIGGNNPLFIIPASFFLSYLLQGIESATLFSRIPMETGYLIQGLIFLLITGKTGRKND